MRDEVGLSFEAIVGTVTTGRPSLSAIPFAASSDLPPPIPIDVVGTKSSRSAYHSVDRSVEILPRTV